METVVEKQAASLRDLGHDVTIMTCRPDRTSPLRETRPDGTRIVRLRALNFVESRFGVTYPVTSPTDFFGFWRLVREHEVVHIHDVFYMSSHLAALVCWLQRREYYLTQHVAFVDHPSRLVMLVQQIVYGTWGDAIMRRAARVVCYNANVKNFLLARGVRAGNVLQNYNGIDTNFFAPATDSTRRRLRERLGLPVDAIICLFVGRFVPKKGYDLIATAASDDYHLLLVGGNRPTKTPEDPRVTYYGLATQDQLRDLYQLSDVFVFPAIGEMLTLVQQEAMACGLPQVTAENSGYDEYGLDTHLMKFVTRTSAALRGCLSELASDESLRREMAAYARQLAVERFDWSANYNLEYSIYSETSAT